MKSTLSLLALLALAACTPSQPSAPAPSRAPAAPFSLDFRALEEIEIVRDDHAAGTRWSARLQRMDQDAWQIASAPENEPLTDSRANGGIVQHLLDTLNGARIRGQAPHGDASSLGLDPPLAVFRWKLHGSQTTSGELWVGKPVGQSQPGFYARVNGGAPVILVGAAFQRILEMIPSFAAVREMRLLPLSLDDVDEIFCTGPTPERYAQRGGDTWMDAKDHPLKDSSAITDWLTRLADARILNFLPTSAPGRAQLLLTLKGRGKELAQLRIWAGGDHAFLASVNTRPGGMFRLNDSLKPLLFCPKGLSGPPSH